jgi:hypothetical protein
MALKIVMVSRYSYGIVFKIAAEVLICRYALYRDLSYACDGLFSKSIPLWDL